MRDKIVMPLIAKDFLNFLNDKYIIQEIFHGK